MNKVKKIISIMIISLMMINIITQNVYAEINDISTTVTENYETNVNNETSQENSVTNTTDVNGSVENQEQEKNNLEENDSNNQDNNEQNKTGENQKKEESFDQLNYLVISKPYVERGDLQNIIVSIGNGNKQIEQAVLKYHRQEDGKSYQEMASQIDGDALVFKISYEDIAETGVYCLDEVEYMISGSMQTIELNQVGISGKYGVNKESETEADANVVSDENDNKVTADAEIVSFDENGKLVSENSIEEAISEQKQNVSTKTKGRSVEKNKNVVVVLDPGHDVSHAGTRGNGLKEEELTLKIAQYCKAELEEYSGVTVYMTRNSENCPHPGTTSIEDNAQRVAYAKSVNANVYVSIHLNSAGAAAKGAEVYYPNQNYRSDIGKEGGELAQKVLNQLISLGLENRGIRIRNSEDHSTYEDGSLADYYGVIKGSKKAGFPGIIIEHAFVSNSNDATFLSNENNLKQLGIADASGIAEYFNLSKGYWETGSNGEKYYYRNGEKVTGEQCIAGQWYYFDVESGKMVTGLYNLGDKTVYYGQDGAMRYGEQAIGGFWYYFDVITGAMKTGFQNVDGKVVYYGSDGRMCYGEQAIEGYYYYFDNITGAMKNGFQNINGKIVYYESDGKMCHGEVAIEGYWYFFDTVTGAMQTGFQNVGNKEVYYGSDGKMCHGEVAIEGYWYLFDTVTGAMQTGFQNIGNKEVYYGSDGKMCYGEQKINGKTYYFNMVTGAMQTGLITIEEGEIVYIEPSGEKFLGEKSFNNKWYYFDTNNQGYMSRSTFVILEDGRKVYYGSDGAMRYGEQAVNGKWYYFDTMTGAMQIGFCSLGNKVVYYDSDGKMCYGKKKINGVTYYFDTVTGAMQTGLIKEENGKYIYIKEDGTQILGEYCVNNKWCYFDKNNQGYMSQSTFVILEDGRKVYYGPDGSMLYGEQAVNGAWYYFDTVTGAMQIGFYNLGSKIVYYDQDGVMCYGEQKIDDQQYAFDEVTGAMIRDGWFKGKYYSSDGTLKSEQSYYPIEGNSSTTVEQMVRFYNKYCGSRQYPSSEFSRGGASTIEELARIFYQEANDEGIKVEVAWAQTMLETNFLAYGGQVKVEQFNFAGLGAVDGGAAGASFATVQMGVRAQIQHLKAYANASITSNALKHTCVDERFKYVTKGCSPYVEWLGQQENPYGKGWATSAGYGMSIRALIQKIMNS